MRLLCVSHPCATAANQVFYARLARRTGWDVALVVPSQWRTEYGKSVAQRHPEFDGDLIALPVVGKGNIPLHVYAARLRALFRALRPDAVYVHHEPYMLATAQALAATPRRVAAGFYSAQNIVKRFPFPVAQLERLAHRRADFAAPVSDAVLEVLRAKGYSGAAEVLPLPVELDRYVPATAREAGALRVGYVGRLAPEKGVDVLLDAAALAGVPLELVICGDGSERDALRRRAAGLGVSVDWRGYVPHDRVHEAFRELDLLAVPSRTVPGWREQFGRVVVEALACAVPVVASASGELPRLLRDTAGGWLVPEDDPAALAACIRAAAADPEERARRGAAGRAAAERLFGVDAVADRFAALVEGAVARRTLAAAQPEVSVA